MQNRGHCGGLFLIFLFPCSTLKERAVVTFQKHSNKKIKILVTSEHQWNLSSGLIAPSVRLFKHDVMSFLKNTHIIFTLKILSRKTEKEDDFSVRNTSKASPPSKYLGTRCLPTISLLLWSLNLCYFLSLTFPTWEKCNSVNISDQQVLHATVVAIAHIIFFFSCISITHFK